jgi:hypothetical protein
LTLWEEPAMGKRLRKSEKADLILSELAKLRDERQGRGSRRRTGKAQISTPAV